MAAGERGAASPTPVAVWLREHGLGEYTAGLAADGYDDLEDLHAAARDDAAAAKDGGGGDLAALVPKAGHRRKILRLLIAAGYGTGGSVPTTPDTAAVDTPAASTPAAAMIKPLALDTVKRGVSIATTTTTTTSASPERGDAGGDGEFTTPREVEVGANEGFLGASPVGAAAAAASASASATDLCESWDAAATSSASPSPSPATAATTTTAGATRRSGAGASVSLSASASSSRAPAPAPRRAGPQAPVAPLAAHSEWLASAEDDDILPPPTPSPDLVPAKTGGGGTAAAVAGPTPFGDAAAGIDDLGMLKIIVVGDSGAGKTSLIEQLVSGRFNAFTKATIGMDWREKRFHVSGLGEVTAQYWDISGQERFANITRVYYRGARGAIVCYDRSVPQGLAAVSKWKADIDAKLVDEGGGPVPCVLVAAKCDLPAADGRTAEELDAHARGLGFAAHLETSAKTGHGVNAVGEHLTRQVLHAAATHAPPGSAAAMPGFASHVAVVHGDQGGRISTRREQPSLNVHAARRSVDGRKRKKKCCGDA